MTFNGLEIFTKHKNLVVVKKDIRDISTKDLIGYEKIIHLANIANDPSAELDKDLSWDVNVLAIKNLVERSILSKIKHLFFLALVAFTG